MWNTLRATAVGLVLGFFVAVAPSCSAPKKCTPESCPTGCCTDKAECISGNETGACGKGGIVCTACGTDEACTDQLCMKTGGQTDGGPDAGPVDAGPPPCVKDDDCVRENNGSRCDTATGQCVAARGCNADSDCQVLDQNDYCYQYGIQCRCTTDSKAPNGNTGVCRRRLGVCEECKTDSDCGTGFVFDPVGACKQLPGDATGKKYCLQQKQGSCPCGMIDDGAGFCKPQTNSCSQVGCTVDKDCPGGSVCNASACLCEPRCRWDFNRKELAAPGCPPGKTCWVDNANLDPASIFYGAGRCRPPCSTNGECTTLPDAGGGNPFAGPKLKCAGEALSGGGTSEKRCRANGECMDNAECPEAPAMQIELGYCDRASFKCKSDCRTGTDPITGQAYKDCRAPYACATDGGSNFCRLLTCVEQGGAHIACTRGQYCCGEDKDNDGKADPCPPQAQLGPDNCYNAPVPPYCTKCMGPDDCKQVPPYLTGTNKCANGSVSPSCSPFPPVCVTIGMGANVCAPSTFNNRQIDSFNVAREQKGCPAGYQATAFRPKYAQGDNYCNTDGDCNVGTDAGRCAPDPQAPRLMDGGIPKACLCTAGSGKSQCPNNADAGVLTDCRDGVAGSTQFCVESVACLLPGTVYVQDAGAPLFGCGLKF